MKPAALAVAAAGFGIAFLVASAGGHRLTALESPTVDVIDESDLPADMTGDDNMGEAITDNPAATDQQNPAEALPEQPAVPEAPAAEPTTQAVRPVAQGEFVPPAVEPSGLEREAPRAPLSDLSLALPPKPKVTAEWDGTTLFQPVASAAGRIEAKGVRVAISGVAPLASEESCSFEGKQWNCGTRARTAFRGLLRSRAVVCDMPADAAQGDVVARCRIGRLDVGEWLVANGWARAEAGGPYEDAGKKAESDGKGIYGAPPERFEMTLTPAGSTLPATEPPPAEPATELPAQ